MTAAHDPAAAGGSEPAEGSQARPRGDVSASGGSVATPLEGDARGAFTIAAAMLREVSAPTPEIVATAVLLGGLRQGVTSGILMGTHEALQLILGRHPDAKGLGDVVAKGVIAAGFQEPDLGPQAVQITDAELDSSLLSAPLGVARAFARPTGANAVFLRHVLATAMSIAHVAPVPQVLEAFRADLPELRRLLYDEIERIKVREDMVAWRVLLGDDPEDIMRILLEPLGDAGGAEDGVELISDAHASVDRLRRRPLIQALAKRLERLRRDEPGTSFLIHIDGPWGSGKSSLLEFLRTELGEDWLAVRFDAWRQMPVGQPRWALLVSLRRALSADCNSRRARTALRCAETWTRAPRVHLLCWSALLAAVVVTLVALPLSIDIAEWQSAVGAIAALAASAAALVGLGAAASRFLLWESSLGARIFEQSHSDPMERLADHFGWLLAKARKPVVFFVDDLDRCTSDYVVELLDAIQTLVRDAAARSGDKPDAGRAAYVVVAADGRWIRSGYQRHHEEFEPAVGRPGRPIGYLFLDKIFQLTVEVPSMSSHRQQAYLHELLRSQDGATTMPADLAAETAHVKEAVGSSASESDTLAVFTAASPRVRAAVAGDVVQKLAEPQIERATEHALLRFAPLLERNPRAMKRFVNAYGIGRAVQVIDDSVVGRDELALWTIVRVRWPALADHLRASPGSIDAFAAGEDAPPGVPESLASLFGDGEVKRVVAGAGSGSLTAQSIRACCGLLSSQPGAA